MNRIALSVIGLAAFAALSIAQSDAKAKAAPGAKQDCCPELAKTAKAAQSTDCCAQEAQAAAKTDECCKSTEAKPMAKGDPGCCNAKGQPARFKVYVAGSGYQFFGCEGSAGKARQALLKSGAKVGKVQKVSSKVLI
jgi:hypothetical protein